MIVGFINIMSQNKIVKSFLSIFTPIVLLMSFNALAGGVWFRAKVLDISIRNTDELYIRLEGNPNPANCGNNFAGAQWSSTGKGQQMAAGIALTAKSTGKYVRMAIRDDTCGAANWPQAEWITLQ